jgi:hypothetical protein
MSIYRDNFKATDEFMAQHFTMTCASPAAKRTWILLMTRHASQPITFGMKENNYLVEL